MPEEFDVLSIDVDGQDYYLWEALSGFRPQLVVIEYNSGLPAGKRLLEPRAYSTAIVPGYSDFFGASLGALVALGKDKGYTLIHLELAGVNAFFVRDDLGRADPAGRGRPASRAWSIRGGVNPPAVRATRRRSERRRSRSCPRTAAASGTVGTPCRGGWMGIREAGCRWRADTRGTRP